jgi:predicted nucleotidyltransferase component of viral defense system
MNRPPRDISASVRQRLLNLARERQDDFQTLLNRYGVERLLYRLSRSAHADRFVLKGATLFSLWMSAPYRPTRDLDLLGRGDDSPAGLEAIFRDICDTPVEPDGLEFQAASVSGAEIREDEVYGGIRIKLTAMLARAHVPLQVDIGFGDAITPAAPETDFPTLLDFPAPHLRVYPRETVVAEKFQAITVLGLLNSRMKDFYDLWKLSREFAFEGVTLCAALKATFARRQTPVPGEPPIALTAAFYENETKQRQWDGFLQKGVLEENRPPLAEIVTALGAFLMPPAEALAQEQHFDMVWPAGGPWTNSASMTNIDPV